MSNFTNFRIRCRAKAETPTGLLYQYLGSGETELPVRQMVLWSLSAYWRPLACQWSGRYSADRLQAIARLSIGTLRQQIEFLAYTFGLEEEVGVGSGNGLRPPTGHHTLSSNQPAINAAPGNPVPDQHWERDNRPPTAAEVPEIIWGSPEDDDLLDQMFK